MNWSSIDVRQKYRDEKTRREAHYASRMREIEAVRMEREPFFIPVVK